LVGEEPEILCAALRGGLHEANRLTGIDGLDERDLLGAGLDRVGDAVQEAPALGAVDLPPRGKRALGGTRGGIDIARVSGRDRAEQPAIDRRAVLERLAGETFARLAVDVVAQGRVAKAPQVLLGF